MVTGIERARELIHDEQQLRFLRIAIGTLIDCRSECLQRHPSAARTLNQALSELDVCAVNIRQVFRCFNDEEGDSE